MGFYCELEMLAAEARTKEKHMKIFAKCDNCSEMGELRGSSAGRPEGWVAADFENAHGRVSLVLCSACGEAKLGPLLPKPKEVPSAG